MQLIEKSISVDAFKNTPYYHRVAPATHVTITLHPELSTHPNCVDSRKDGYLDYPEQYVIELPNAKIVGFTGTTITQEGRLFHDYVSSGNLALDDTWKPSAMESALEVPLTPTQHIDGTVAIIAGPSTNAFYHWMTDLLPRLETLRRSGLHWDKLYVSHYNNPKTPFIKETLDAYGITEDQIFDAQKTTVITADKVLIPSLTTHLPHARPSWGCDFLRNLFIDDEEMTRTIVVPTKLYIARKSFSLPTRDRREIINEDEIMGYLSTQGFIKVYLEDLSLKEQAQLFNSAEVIIAAHGAALVNLVHCNRDKTVKLLEFFHPDHVNQSYWHMTQQLNKDRGFHFDHTCLLTPTDGLQEEDHRLKNFKIPLEMIKDALNLSEIKVIKGLWSGKEHAPHVMNLLENSLSVKSFMHTPYYHRVAPAEQLSVTPNPVLSTHKKNKDCRKDGHLDFPEQYVISLPHATFAGYAGVVITHDGHPCIDYATSGNKLFNDNWKLEQREAALNIDSLTPSKHIDGTVAIITGPESYSFYHWMMDDLPRLETLRKSGIKWDKLYISNYNAPYVQETLTAFGITKDQIINASRNTVLSADTVLIPSMPTLLPQARPTWVCDFIRALFINDATEQAPAKGTKLYISRKKVVLNNDRRQVVNEDEVMAYLSTQGFTQVCLEELSLKEQAQLFNSANTIVAAHGAGLLNLVYCKRDAVRVIEFFHPDQINQSYWNITQQLNKDRGFHFDHTCLITPTDSLSEEDHKVRNLTIPLEMLQDCLEKK